MAIICLIGSARFEAAFHEAETQLTQMGHVVLSKDPIALARRKAEGEFDVVEVEMFSLVHLEKIRQADVVLIINGDEDLGAHTTTPYIGESTAREIIWARIQGKVLISRQEVSGWGHLADLIDERYAIESGVGLRLMIDARNVLNKVSGMSVVGTMMADSVHSIMTAALSVIASRGDMYSGSFATAVLEAVGADPIENVDMALAGVVGIPADYCGLRPQNEGDAKPVEDMVTLERRRLVGTIIMMQAVGNMLAQRGPKLKREEAIEKLDMAVQTCIDSFNLTYKEIDEARESSQD